jgi:prevent-host-death family protein
MAFQIVLAPEAAEDLKGLKANVRAVVRDALEAYLRHEPKKISRSRIKRLRGYASTSVSLASGRRSGLLRRDRINGGNFGDCRQGGDRAMARTVRKSKMKQIALSEVKDDLSNLLRQATKQDIVITRHGKPAGILIGFESEDDWIEYRLENDPRFLKRVEQARANLRAGRGIRLENLKN